MTRYDVVHHSQFISSVSQISFGKLSFEGLVDERVHGQCDAYHSCEDDAPCVGAVESAGGGDGNGAEQNGCGEGYESDVSAGDVLLEGLHNSGHDQTRKPRGESSCGENIHSFLLR